MNLFNNLRKRIVHKLLRSEDGYTYTGLHGGMPIKFYYQYDTNRYLLGMHNDTMYYYEPTLTGWSAVSSRCLPWGQTVDGHTYNQEPQEINFQRWIFGILDNIYHQYGNRLESITLQELRNLKDYKREESSEEFVITRESFCDIMEALDAYWTHLRVLEGVLDVYFEKGMMVDIIDSVVDALEKELEPQFYDPELDFDIDEDPLIMRWLTGVESDRTVDGRLLETAGDLYDYLVEKKENVSENT